MIIVDGYQTYIDWAEYKPHKIDETKIKGFELYWRGDADWFVKVVPKEGEKYYIAKGTHRRGISELLANPKAKIIGIFNDLMLDGFSSELTRVMPSV